VTGNGRSLRAVLLIGGAWLARGGVAGAQPLPTAPPDEALEERVPHPEPRVIVNVLSVRGPHDPDRVQHDARLGWSRIVRCYRAAGPWVRVTVKLELTIAAAGSVAAAKPAEVEPKTVELARCLAAAFAGLPMPKAPADSVADVEIRLAPGDRG
jgi:hypothetical protein